MYPRDLCECIEEGDMMEKRGGWEGSMVWGGYNGGYNGRYNEYMMTDVCMCT